MSPAIGHFSDAAELDKAVARVLREHAQEPPQPLTRLKLLSALTNERPCTPTSEPRSGVKRGGSLVSFRAVSRSLARLARQGLVAYQRAGAGVGGGWYFAHKIPRRKR